MNALIFALLAGGCTSLASLSFRLNGNKTTTTSPAGYLLIFYLASFILSFLLSPELWQMDVNLIILAFGAVVGLLNSVLMVLTSRALKEGPSGLTFAFQNTSAIFPGLILFLVLGIDFGFSYSLIQFAGIILVVGGLFLGTKNETLDSSKTTPQWLKYALACFTVQILALTFMQARVVLFSHGDSLGFLADYMPSEKDDIWFMPGLFGAAFLMQLIAFLREKKGLGIRESIYGGLGGIGNFGSTGLLLLATKVALPFEQGILFPCFAVTAMVLCNVWANRLYHEKFNLLTNLLCSSGIFLAVAS